MDEQISFYQKNLYNLEISASIRAVLLRAFGTVSNSRAKKVVSYVWLSHKRQCSDRLTLITKSLFHTNFCDYFFLFSVCCHSTNKVA